MQFNIASLLKEPTGAMRQYEIDDDLTIEGEALRLRGHVRFDRTPAGVLVRARLRGTLEAECSRCLKPVAREVVIEFEEEYLPSIDLNTGAQVSSPEGQEDAYRIDARHVLDLALPAQQYWSLAAPMAPLCAEDCAGLCGLCGADLNVGIHACDGEPPDGRWAELAKLRQA